MLKTSAVVLESHYFPCIQYFTKLMLADIAYIEQHEHYVKGSYRNRCHIAGANSMLRLSIPLQKGKNQQMPIKEVRIAYDEPWQTQHWMTIQSAYRKAPFFEYYSDIFYLFFEKRYEFLWDFNMAILKECLNLLQFSVKIALTSSYENIYTTNTKDYRNVISPKFQRQKEDECFSPVMYAQLFEERYGFLPNLSILDLLFCAGPQSVLILERSISYDNNTRQ